MGVLSIRKILILAVIFLSLAFLLTSCNGVKLDPKNPVTITMWHNYGGQMQSAMDALVDEFNNSLGRKKGVMVNVTSISGSASIQEKLFLIAAGDPGAPLMPNIVTTYPKTALTLVEEDLIVPLDDFFTDKELEAYLPQFIAEGCLTDGNLYVFPVAKSTEVLFVNQTLFDRFSAATGAGLEDLATFEGLGKVATDYHQWATSQSPSHYKAGTTFFTADSWFNIAQVGTAQLGGDFVTAKGLETHGNIFRHIWDCTVLPAITGGYAITTGYSSDLVRTGEILCSTGSTAGILFYGDQVTYPDNTTEKVSFTVLPYPTFEAGQKIALQRGGGMCIGRATPEKEYAAALFLKWFTQPEQNMRFVSSTGYLPVTKKAFEVNMQQEIDYIENENLQKLLRTVIEMYKDYTFLVPPNYENFDALSKEYETKIKEAMLAGKDEYLATDQSINDLNADIYQKFLNF